jgi:hypothetical protein
MTNAQSPPHRSSDPPRYGDYPELFWDLQPEEDIDVEHPFVLARLLTQATPETIARLAPTSLIRRELATLPIPEHTRLFWRMILDSLDRPQTSRSGAGA